jgi:hypothetical protein
MGVVQIIPGVEVRIHCQQRKPAEHDEGNSCRTTPGEFRTVEHTPLFHLYDRGLDLLLQ